MIKKKIITICFVPCVLVILFSFGGCGKQDEPVSPEPSNVKSFKIDKIEKSSTKDGSENTADDQSMVKPADAGGGAPPVSTVRAEPEPPKDVAVPETVAKAPENAPVEPVAQVDDANVDPDQKSDLSAQTSPEKTDDLSLSPAYAAINSGESGNKGLIYNPEGKIDPFEPLFRGKQEKAIEVSGKSQTIRSARIGKLTPLEKMDISQLKLTAIIMGQQKNIAMVQESTGKGHVVSTGTYIGINSGRVVDITKNTVVIEEEVEDLLGKIIVRKRELKLQKPLGEM